MSYFNNLRRALFGKSAAIISGGSMPDYASGKPYQANRTVNALVQKNVSWVYAMIDRNGKAVADQCLRLYAKRPTTGSKSRFPSRSVSDSRYKYLCKSPHLQKFVSDQEDIEEITDHPFLDVIHRGGGHYIRYDLFYLLTNSMDSTGNGYWLKDMGPLQVVTDIWPMLPQLVSPVADKKNFLQYYEYGVGNSKLKIPREKVVHYKYASLRHPFIGSGPLEAGCEAADLGMAMNNYEVAMFRNGGTPDVKLTYPEGVRVDGKEKDKIRRDYERKFSQPHNAGKMITLTEGADVVPFSISPKEMSYLKGRQWSRDELAAIFGVPVTFFALDGVVKANLSAAVEIYMRMTIKPKLTVIEETMNEQLLPDFDENLFVAYDNPVPEDDEFRLKEITARLLAKYSSINEERALDGLDPVPWGDKPEEPEPIEINSTEEVYDKPPKKKVKAKYPALAMPAADFIPEEFTAAMVAYFAEQGKVILGLAAEAEFKSVKIAEDIVGPWFNMAIWDAALTRTIKPFVRATIMTAGQRALETVGPDRFFDESDPRLVSAMQRRVPSIRGINRHTQSLVRGVVANGIAAGEPGNTIQRNIRGIFASETAEDIGRYRATLIARTETIWAMNEGAVIGYKQSGVVSQVEWLTAQDERTCQFCEPMDGRVQTLGTSFYEMGTEMEGRDGGLLKFTAEPIEHPPLHPQCRCSLAPIL